MDRRSRCWTSNGATFTFAGSDTACPWSPTAGVSLVTGDYRVGFEIRSLYGEFI